MNKKNLTRRSLILLLALTLILSMMPVASVWADDSNDPTDTTIYGAVDLDMSKTKDLLSKIVKYSRSKRLVPVYVNVDMGEGHDALAAEVYDDWTGMISSYVPDMDISGMSIEGSKAVLAVPSIDNKLLRDHSFTENSFKTLLSGVIIAAKTGKNVSDGSVVDNKSRFIGVGEHEVSFYGNYEQFAKEFVDSAKKTLQADSQFYVLWSEPVTEVNLELGDLVCGTVVKTTFKNANLTQEPKPEVTTADTTYSVTQRLGVEKYGVDLPLWTTGAQDVKTIIVSAAEAIRTPAADTGSDSGVSLVIRDREEIKSFIAKVQDGIRKMVNGDESSFTVKGDEAYTANVVLDSSFGRFFDKDTEIKFTLNGEAMSAEDYSLSIINLPDSAALLQIFTTAEHDWDEGTITKEPTLEENGEELFTCSVCGETRTEEVSNEEIVKHYKELKAKYTPSKAKIKSVKTGVGKASVKWYKVKKATAYKVRLTNKKTGKVRNYTVKGTGKVFKKLAKNRKYSVKVRAYTKVEGYTFYGKWSKAKTFKTKK